MPFLFSTACPPVEQYFPSVSTSSLVLKPNINCLDRSLAAQMLLFPQISADPGSNFSLFHQAGQYTGSLLFLSFSTRRRNLKLLLPPSGFSVSAHQFLQVSLTVFSCSIPLTLSLPALVRGAPEKDICLLQCPRMHNTAFSKWRTGRASPV